MPVVDIQGRIAIVTGAGSGIGRATALRLADEGAAVVVVDIDGETAEMTAGEIGAAGGDGLSVRADIADGEDVGMVFAVSTRTFGPLDILVNNAGIRSGSGSNRSDELTRVLDVNLRGTVLCSIHAIEAMSGRGGAIVNVGSVAGLQLGPTADPVYAATKAAVVRWTSGLADLERTLGIRVNCVCPDWVDTPMVRHAQEEMSEEQWSTVAPGRLLDPSEVAGTLIRLITDESLAGRIVVCRPGSVWTMLPEGAGLSPEVI
jgi:NAD(P)-dependent dehydrogenase (short-subunit alcohol dehydrogenase family)